MKAQALLLALLLLPAAQAAPFLMHRADAMGTGAVSDVGPSALDTSYFLPVAGRNPFVATPLIIDGHAYLLTTADQEPTSLTPSAPLVDGESQVWRLDIENAQLISWIALGPRIVAAPLASDGATLFVVSDDAFEAYDIKTAERIWGQDRGSTLPPQAIERQGWRCPYSAVHEGTWLLVCRQESGWRAWSLDVETGDTRWRVDSAEHALADELPTPTAAPDELAVAVSGETLVIATTRAGLYPYHMGNAAALSLETGEWQAGFYLAPGGAITDIAWWTSQAAPGLAITGGGDGFVLNKPRSVARYDVGVSGLATWEIDSPFGDATSNIPAVARVGDDLYVPREGALFRASATDGSIIWPERASDAPNVRSPATSGLLATSTRLWTNAGAEGLLALSTADGRILDQTTATRIGGNVRGFAVGDGVLVVHGSPPNAGLPGAGAAASTSIVAVIGTTAASIAFDAGLSEAFPGVEEPVRIQTRVTRAGALASDVAFRIDWGDGYGDEVGDGEATHAYDEAGDYVIRLVASNSAGQEASQRFTVHVGQQRPNFISTAFSPENQEQTFFLLGVILTLLFAGFGVLRLRRKRGILQRELRAVDAVIENAKDDPAARQAALQERRAHARGLLADGKIEDAHHTVLQHYIDDASTRTRVGTLESELPFLPLGLAQALKEMLGDAKITDWEHRHFVEALGKDALLTATQKKKVQRLVDAWFEQDRGVV